MNLEQKDRDSIVICDRLFVLVGSECLSSSDPRDEKEKNIAYLDTFSPQLCADCNKIFVYRGFVNAARACATLLNRANKLMLPGEQEARSAHSAHFCKKPIVNMLPC